MNVLPFENSDAFYQRLAAQLKKREPVRIDTDIRRYRDLPGRLVKVLALEKLGGSEYYDVVADGFREGLTAISHPSLYGLVVPAAALGGAAIGARVGGALGVVVGLAGGSVVGAVTTALMRSRCRVEVEVAPDGTLGISVIPTE